MAIVEEFTFTSAFLDKAEALKKKKKLTWEEVARELHCNPSSLQRTISRRRYGHWKGQNDTDMRPQHRALIEQRVLAGDSARQIREKLKEVFGLHLKAGAMSMRLRNMGYDKEVRDELKREVKVS